MMNIRKLGSKKSVGVKGIKGALSSLGQFLAAERPLQMMKNASYFTLKALSCF